MELWQYSGKPPDEEIAEWLEIDGNLSDHLAIRHECPNCGSRSTRWIRQEWSACFNCLTPFTTDEAMDYMQFLREEYYDYA